MINYLILGAIQGIFEWLPISSEGVVAIFSQLLIKDLNAIEVALFLHLGTLFAVLIYFFEDWKEILFFKNKKLIRFLIITTIVSGIVGFFLYQLVITIAIGSYLLLFTGFGLLFTAYFHKKKKRISLSPNKLALISGLLQGLAVIPGLSRSAATIFGLSLGKENPKEILKLSYLMSAPVVAASSFYLYIQNPVNLACFWPALLTSFFVGILALKIILVFSQRIDFFKFAIFFALLCFIGGIISLI
jgi:undecaprenyl-diphosphatase